MRTLRALSFLLLSATAATAGCNPMPGLAPDQWLALCGADLQQAYVDGPAQQGIPFQTFAQYVYGLYAQSSMQPAQAPAAAGMCPIGAQQCFSGWARSCQYMADGRTTWWVTSAQRC